MSSSTNICTPKVRMFASACLVVVGFILLIIGIVRVHYQFHQDSTTLTWAKAIVESYDAFAELRLAQNPSSSLKNTTISLTSDSSATTFTLNQATVDFPLYGSSRSTPALSVAVQFQSYPIQLGSFPPKIAITTTFPLHPMFNTSTPEGHKKQDQIDKVSVQNVSFQTTGNPTKTFTVRIFCDNSSCDVVNMGAGFCSDKYISGTFTKPVDEHGNTILSCQKDVSVGNLAAGYCGSCSYLVTMTRYCQTVKPFLISDAVWDNATGFLVKPANWTWLQGNVSENQLYCNPLIATSYDSGLRSDGAPTPSTIELVVVNLENPVSYLTNFLWIAGPCPYPSAQQQQQDQDNGIFTDVPAPCFPSNVDNFPSRSAGVAFLVFGILFGMVGLIFAWYYRLQVKEDEYGRVPSSWRQVQYNNNNNNANANNNNNQQLQ